MHPEIALALTSGIIAAICLTWSIVGFEPADLIQEARLAILQQLSRYDPSRASLGTWARQVVRSHLHQIKRQETQKGSRRPLTEALLPSQIEDLEGDYLIDDYQGNPVDDPEETAVSRTYAEQVAAVIRSLVLTERDQQILDGILAGETDETVAARLGVSRQSVSQRRARLTQRLRRILQARGYPSD
jgi:RNA polymerase sigma factor (sigma-70 family)